MTQGRKFQYAVIAALIIAYVALRLWRLADACLWFDEIFSVHAAEQSWNSILNFVALDLIHPPLFYVLLKLWIAVGGESVFWLRLLPVVFSIIAIFSLVALCRELKLNFSTQALALFFIAVNGSLIKYAQEVRMYSLLMCLALFSMWLFARYFWSEKSFAVLIIVNILLVYTHYFGWFVIASEIVAILVFQRIKLRQMAAMFGIVSVSFLPWLIAVFQAANSGSDLGQNIGWMSRPGVREICVFIFNLIEPFYSQAASSEPASIYRVSISILLIVIVSWIAYLQIWKSQTEDERRTTWLLLVFIKLPVTIALVASWLLPYSIWGTRHLIIIFAPFTILIAIVVANIPVRWLRISSVTLLLMFSGYAFALHYSQPMPRYSWCVLEDLIGIEEVEQVGRVYTTEDFLAYHIWFMYRREPPFPLTVVKVEGIPGVAKDSAYFLPHGFTNITSTNLNDVNDRRLCLVFRGSQKSESEPPLRNFISMGYRVLEQREIAAHSEIVFLVLVGK